MGLEVSFTKVPVLQGASVSPPMPTTAMTNRQEPITGFSADSQKVEEAERKGEAYTSVASNKIEKARVVWQHSHGGTLGETPMLRSA